MPLAEGPLSCSRCGISSYSRSLRTMINGERLCSPCIRCEYFEDTDVPTCEGRPVAFVEPKPVGEFRPALLCVQHVFPWTQDMANLGPEWSITALSSEDARLLGSIQ